MGLFWISASIHKPKSHALSSRRYLISEQFRWNKSKSRRYSGNILAVATSEKSTSTRNTPSSASKALVIVESPAKARTIQKILGADQYIVESCVGHIRDMPKSAKQIPAKYKDLHWSRLGVNVDDGFKPLYVTVEGKQKIITSLRNLMKQSERLILATDDDREGEAISWHLQEVLKPKIPVSRAVFHEITPAAVKKAFEEIRQVNGNLVEAQEARRVLDRLTGYTVSPLLWKKIAKNLSAGRVQSVALNMIVNREKERLQFCTALYYDMRARLRSRSDGNNNPEFMAVVTHVAGKRLAAGRDFDEKSGRLKESVSAGEVVHFSESDAVAFCQRLEATKDVSLKVNKVEKKRKKRAPPQPLITSSLQQAASRQLGLGAGQTMRVAQSLYENGLITYMRTDHAELADDAKKTATQYISEHFGNEYVAGKEEYEVSKKKKKNAKNSQEAHEAIRPAGEFFVSPERSNLEGIELALYSLIYRRTIASQMKAALVDSTTISIEVQSDSDSQLNKSLLRVSGSTVAFSGFLKVYEDQSNAGSASSSDSEDEDGSSLSSKGDSNMLPVLQEGDNVDLVSVDPISHSTKPPARFTDASLVRELERCGVGRPSTYASVIETLITREYVRRARSSEISALAGGGAAEAESTARSSRLPLAPRLTAFAVDALLSRHFPNLVDKNFTASMEACLDQIAIGEADRVSYLNDYYFGEGGLHRLAQEAEVDDGQTEARLVVLPKRQNATGIEGLEIRVGSYGPYIEYSGKSLDGSGADGESNTEPLRFSLPKDILADELCDEERVRALLKQAEDPTLGMDPESGLPVLLRTGRYGPYIQLGSAEDYPEGEKPRGCGLLRGMDPGSVTLEVALQLLSFPRNMGTHPATKNTMMLHNGPFGAYLQVGDRGFSVNVPASDDLLSMTPERAIEIVDDKIAKMGGLGAVEKREAAHRHLGLYRSKPVVTRPGRFGPYLAYGKARYAIPQMIRVEDLTLEDAVSLINRKKAGESTTTSDFKAEEKLSSRQRASPATGKKPKASAASKVATTGTTRTRTKAKKSDPEKLAKRSKARSTTSAAKGSTRTTTKK